MPMVTHSPIAEAGTATMRGWMRTDTTGSKARVMKKFQCTPYSETCS